MRYRLYDRRSCGGKDTPDWIKIIAEVGFEDVFIVDMKSEKEVFRLKGYDNIFKPLNPNINIILDLLNEKEERIESLEDELWSAGNDGYRVNDPVVRKRLDAEWLLRNPDWKSNPDIICSNKEDQAEYIGKLEKELHDASRNGFYCDEDVLNRVLEPRKKEKKNG
jgi:hypothetical protein